MSNPHVVTKQFESALCEYTGAPFAVAVNSCTAALRLAFDWLHFKAGPQRLVLPKLTYVSVPWQAIQAGHKVVYEDIAWQNWYLIKGSAIIDGARWLERDMCLPQPGRHICISLHAQKPLGLEQGGVILHDSAEADAFYRMARFDGRREGVPVARDTFELPVRYRHHCYLNPSTSALGVQRLYALMHHDHQYADVSAISQ